MSWTITHDLGAFEAAAGPVLRARPVLNTVPLTLLETLRGGNNTYGDEPPLYGWWADDTGAVAGAFLQTPPFPALLTPVPDQAAVALAEQWDPAKVLPGINSGPAVATAFAGAWGARTGARAEVRMRTRLYRLDKLTPPDPAPPGRARVAGPADRDLLVRWFEAFMSDVGETGRDIGAMVDERLTYRGCTLWESEGRPVSLAGVSRAAAGTVRVMNVYTPPELRGRGYAGAVTAAVSQAALDEGAAEVLLFTDLSNPTSNALYQRLGYVPVDDRLVLEFV